MRREDRSVLGDAFSKNILLEYFLVVRLDSASPFPFSAILPRPIRSCQSLRLLRAIDNRECESTSLAPVSRTHRVNKPETRWRSVPSSLAASREFVSSIFGKVHKRGRTRALSGDLNFLFF